MLALLALACAPEAADTTAPCAAEVTAPAWVVEGEPLTVLIRCTGPDAYEGTAAGLPEGASFDGRALTWTPGLADAGTYAAAVFERPVNGGDTEVVPLSIEVVDAWNAPGNEPPDPAKYAREFGLPVIHLFADGELNREDVPATAWIDGTLHTGRMKIRGASSSNYPKPGYGVTFDDDVDLDAWGLGTPDELVLLTTFDDASYVRQKLAFDLWADVAEHQGAPRLTPRTAFVVVYLDGALHGLFVAADRVDAGFLRDQGLDSTGPLYKSVNHDANFRATSASGAPKATPHDGYEQKEGALDDWAALDALVAFAANSDTPTFVAGMAAFIDPTEYMDWYLFVRFASAGDSGGKNAYLYAEPPTNVLRYAPWDMNHSFGQDWRTIRVPTEDANDFRWTNQIFVHLQDDPTSHATLAARWDDLTTGPFGAASLQAHLDDYYGAIDPAARRDFERWGPDYFAYGGWAGDRQSDFLDYEGERAYLADWLAARAAWATSVAP